MSFQQVATTLLLFKADVSDLKAKLKEAQGAEKEALQQSLDAAQARNDSLNSWAENITKVNVAIAGMTQAASVAVAGFEALEERTRLTAATGAYNLDRLRQATQGLVTDTNLLKLAQSAATATYKLTEAQLETVAQAMIGFERQGNSLADVQEKVGLAIREGSVKPLKELGVNVDRVTGPANQFATVMKVLGERAKEAGAGTDESTDATKRAAVQWENTIDVVKIGIGKLVVGLTPLLQQFQDLASALGLISNGVGAIVSKATGGGGDGSGTMSKVWGAWNSKYNWVQHPLGSIVSAGSAGYDALNPNDTTLGGAHVATAMDPYIEAQNYAAKAGDLLQTSQQTAFGGYVKSFTTTLLEQGKQAATADAKEAFAVWQTDWLAGYGINPATMKGRKVKRGGPSRPYEAPSSSQESDWSQQWSRTTGLTPSATGSATLGQLPGAGGIDLNSLFPAISPEAQGAAAGAYATAGLADNAKAFAQLAASLRQQHKQSVLESIFGPAKEFDAYAEKMQLLKDSFDVFTGALKSGFESWINGSKSAKEALAGVLKQTITGLASSMFAHSIEEGALAIGSLAGGDPVGAALHGKAALGYGAAAIAIGAIAREVNSSGGSGGAAAGGAGGGAPNVAGGGAGGSAGPRVTNVYLGDYFSDSNPRAQDERISRAIRRVQGDSGNGGVRR